MKTTLYLPVQGRNGRLLSLAITCQMLILSYFIPSILYGQQSSLPCNTVTPWVPDTFAVDVDFSSSALACWDGDVLCIIPGSNEPANVVDDDLNNFATGEILVGGTLTLSVTDPVNTYSAGNFTGFVISSTLLDVGVFSGIVLRTYLDDVLQETFNGFDLIGLDVSLFQDPYTIGFVTSSDFDEVEITFATGIGAGLYNVHYAVMERFCAGPDLVCNEETPMNSPDYPMTIDYALTGSTGISLGTIDDPENAISDNPADFATFVNTANVLDTLSIAVEEQITDYPAGTFVGFDIENITVLGLGLLDNIVITSYLNGVEQEIMSGNDLLLGVPLLNSSGRMTVGFVTTTPVDKVRFSIAYPVSVNLGVTLIYSAIFKNFCEGPDLPCNTLTSISSPTYPVYINALNSGFTGAVCLGCTLEDPGNVIDNDADSYAEIDITAGVATIGRLAVKDALTDYPANTFAGFHIENVQLVDLDVLTGITIATYLDGVFAESVTGEDILLTAGTDLLVNQGEFLAGFVTTEPFDEIQINLTNVGMVNIGTTRIYEVVFSGFCPAVIECDTNYFLNNPEFPVYIDFQLTGLDGGVCALCEVEDPDEVITSSNTDFATIMITAGVLQTGSIAVRDALYTYPAGTIAGFVIDDVNDLLQLDLFGSITISTYLDGNLQEFASGANLLDAELLILFINPDPGVYNVGFQTTLPFDEVRITVGALASVINIINVYGAFVDTRNSQGGSLDCPDAPMAMDDQATTPEDTPVSIDVLDNDIDQDSDPALPVITDQPDNGTASVNPVDSTITYTPDPNFVGMDTLAYEICDDGMPPLCDTALVIITVTPVIDTITETIPEDSTLTLCAGELTTFTEDADNLALCEGPSNGTVMITDTCATYTPDPGFNGLDTFCLVTCDPNDPMLCDTTIVIINVTPINEPPVAVDDMATTPEDTPVSIDVLSNDSDPDSPPAIPVITDQPDHGTASVNPIDSTITYTPDPDFVGVDTLEYEICDDGMPPLCDTALVIITVTPVIDTITETIPEDSTLTLCAGELTTFTEDADNLALCDAPSNGSVMITDTCATYTPDPGFNGLDTFCLVTCDPNDPMLCDTTIVIIEVTPVNQPPVAADDMANTPEDTPVSIDVLSNDSDPDSPPAIPVITDQPDHGTATVNPIDSTITYTPDPDFVGMDTLEYEICDDGMPPLCDTAVVIITVTPVIDTITETIPEDSTLTLCTGELTTFTEDADNLALCDGPSNGTVMITDTCATYTPDPGFNGLDTFCLVTCDPNDPMLCDTTIVIIEVTPVNQPPVAADDMANTPEDTPVSIDVLSNDSDPDSPPAIPVITDQPDHGTATVNPIDSTITYTPDPDFVGMDTLAYEICDDGMPPLCDTAIVIITVTPVIDTITETIPEDSTLTLCAGDLTTFTEDADNLALCDGPSNGTVMITDTCATYTPDPGFNGLDTFCLVTCDPNDPMLCDTTIVIIEVTPVNQSPVAADDMANTPEDTPVSIDVLSNDSDPDSPPAIPVITDQPDHATASVNPVDSTITYSPDPDFVGMDTLEYEICDDGMPPLCDTAMVIISVSPVTDTITVTIPEDSTMTMCAWELTIFSEDADNLALCDDPSNGTVSLSDTCATYTPDPGFNGLDTFCLVTCDPNNPILCDTTIVIIEVTPVNQPPVAADDMANTPEDTPVSIDVLSNDSDPDSPPAIPVITDQPDNGTATVNPIDSTITYTPDPDFVGVDTLEYEICDNGMPPLCDTAMVIITVSPVTDTVTVTIPEDSTMTMCAWELTIFSEDADNLALCDDPSNGTVSLSDTCATYTPDPGFNGLDTFCLVTCDPNNPILCDTTIVIIEVTPVNQPPVAIDDMANTPEDTPVSIDVLSNDSDPDSPPAIPVITDQPDNGTATVNPIDSTITYTPDPDFVGVDTLEYEICDDGMPPLCDTAMVIITVFPQTDTVIVNVPEDSMITVCVSELVSFSEPPMDLFLCDGPSNGDVTVLDTCITYTPEMDYHGEDTICVVSCDPNYPGLCDTTIIIVIVDPFNDPPVANDDMAMTEEDQPVTVPILDNDVDIDSPLGMPELNDPPLHGMVVINPLDSTATYTPDPDFVGVDSFTYYICDEGQPPFCDTATVVVTILPVTDTIHMILPQDSVFTVCGDTLAVFASPVSSMSLCADPAFGSVDITGICATYTPDQGYTGQDTFCLVVCALDDPDICDTTIMVLSILPPGCMIIDAYVYLEGSAVSLSGGESYSVPMRNSLNQVKVLPGQTYEDPFLGTHYTPAGQPYSVQPWNYNGTEGDLFDSGGDPMMGDAGYPSTVVDWILVSLRQDAEGSGGPVCQAAALLHQDGSITFVEAFDCCGINQFIPYYLVIEHRNHLIVMSDTAIIAVNDTIHYDFRTRQSYINDPMQVGVYAGQKEIDAGVFAMYAGNGNQYPLEQADTDINFDDRSFWEATSGQTGAYNHGDYNMNSDSNFNDRVVWERNNGKFTSVVRE